MKKRALKLISVVCAFSIIISLCPCFTVSAAVDVSTLTADDLAGTQVPTAITENLTLPEIDGTWSSSNTSVISDNGVVTRPLSEDEEVTMTATPTEGESVSFNFNVKAQTKKVIAQENFAAYAELTNDNHDTNIFGSMTNWQNSTSTGSHIVNNCLEVGFDQNPASAGHTMRWNISPSEKILYFDIDFKRDEKGMPFNLQAYFSAEVDGETAQKLARLATIYDGYVYWGNNASSSKTEYTTGIWHSLSFKIDMDNLKTYGALDGGEWNEVDMLAAYGGNFNSTNVSINYMQRIHFALNSNVSTNLMLDNLVLSTDAHPLSRVSIDSLAGTQVPTAITGNLTLPDMDCTWSSSNPDVISNTGVVTRHANEDKKVTMTATATDGSNETRSFSFTVKAKNKQLVAWDNFNYSDLGDAQGTTDFYPAMNNDWAISAAATGSKIITDSASNKYLEADMSVASAVLKWTKSVEGDVVYLDFDAMRTNAGDTVALQAFVTGQDKDGNTVTRLLRLMTFLSGNIYWGNNANSTGMTAVDTELLKTVSLKIDLANKKIYGSYNGGEWTEVDCTNTSYGTPGSGDNQLLATDTITGISYFRFLAHSSGAANIMLDNFVLSTDAEVSESVADGILDINVDGSKKQIDITSRYDEEYTLTQSFYVRTDTNQHMEYIDQYLTDSNGNKTVLWEKDNYYRSTYPNDESAPLLINYRYFGGNHSTGCALVTKAGHGKTLADVGTMWQAEDGKKWVLAQITDVNRIKFVCAEELPTGSFELERAINGGGSGSLTRLENGIATADTFSYTSQSGNQLFPIVRNSQQTVKAYLKDGTELSVPLNEDNNDIEAEKVVITDSYDITDPTAVAMSLYNNRPDGGYTEANLPNYAPGATVVAYKQIITIMSDGTVLTEFDHEVKQELKMLTYFGIQYYMRNNLGGGVKRLMPGTKAFTATRSTYAHRDSISEDTSQVYNFDFSVPTQLYRDEKGLAGTAQEHYMFNLPHYKVFDNTTWADESIVPNRVIDYMYDSQDNSDIAYAAGFLPIKDAAPEERLKNTTVSFDVDGKAKAYPYLIKQSSGSANKNKLVAGAKIQGVAYRKFENADRFDGKASVYSVPYNDKEYCYIDFFENSTVSFTVDGATEENVIVSQNVGDAVVAVEDGGTITVTGDAKDYVELTVCFDGVVPDVPDEPDVPDVPDVPSDDEVQDPNATVTTDENGTKVLYKLSDIPQGTTAVTLVAALINTSTTNVAEINWTICEDISSLEGDPKEISVSLTGTESDTVKLHYYLCNNMNDLHSLKDFAPAEPDLKTVATDISTADITWVAPDDDYESFSALRYNIYDDGLLINETPVSALNYIAQNLVPGADYHFGVKALDSKNNESNVSNMLKGSTYMPSTITTRIKAKDDTEINGSLSKDGNLVFGPLPSNADTNLFWYKQDRTGGLNCFSSDACYQPTATGTPNYIRGISYLAFWLKNAVNADNVKYAYEFTYYDQHEETGKDAYLDMTYATTRGRFSNRVKLTNDKAWKTVKGIFTAEKPLSPIGDKNAGASSQIFFSNSHSWNSDWSEDRPAKGASLTYEQHYDEDYTKIYRMTLIPLVNGAEETYANYKKLAGASLTIENPAEGEAATIISGLDSNAKGFNSDSEEKPLTTKDGRLAVALAKLNGKLEFTVTDTTVTGKAGNIEICCYAEKETTVTLSGGSNKKIPANTWTKLRFAQDSVANSEYEITANNELYVSSLRVTAN